MPSESISSHTATITYDRQLVRRALNRYFIKRLGKPFFIALLLVAAAFAYLFIIGSWNGFSTFMAVSLLVMLVFIGLIYFARLRAAEGFFDKANEPTVTFVFTDEGVRTESDLGTSDLKWSAFDEILKFSDVWLLVYARSGYITLPVEQLSSDCAQFIDRKMAAARNATAE